LQYDFGVLPHRRGYLKSLLNKVGVVCVVGEPIHCRERIEEPSRENLMAHQKRYLDSLTELFEKHKEEYAPTGTLRFVE
jgi:hypothetical protein